MGATRNTGYLENIILYDSSDNVGIAGAVNASYKVTLGGSLSGTAAVFSSSVTSTAFVPTGSAIPTNGMYLSAANTLNFATNSGSRLSISSTGAATFSSSISATTGVFSSNVNIQKNGSGTVGGGAYYTLYNTATTDGMLWQLNASNNIDFWGLTGNSFTASPVITLTRAGAATFTGRVTAGNSMLLGEIQSSYSIVETTAGNGIWLRPAGIASPSGLFVNTSGNVGIGTASINVARLEVVGAIPTFFTADSSANSPTYGGSIFYRTTNTVNNGNGIQFSLNDSASSRAEYAYIGGLIETNTNGSHNGAIIFAPSSSGNRTERMRITSGGSVGINTSPGNFNGLTFTGPFLDVAGVLQVKGTSANTVALIQLGGDTFRKAFISSSIGTEDPFLAFGTSSSGSASGSEERMRITSGGLSVFTAIKPSLTSTGNGIINVVDSTALTDGVGGSIAFRGRFNSAGDYITGGAIQLKKTFQNTGNTAFSLFFYSRSNGGSLAERMVLTNDGYFKVATDGNIPSNTGNVFRMTDGTHIIRGFNTSTDPYGIRLDYTGASPNGYFNEYLFFLDSTDSRFVVYSNGAAQNRAGVWGTLSDINIKQDIVDSSSQWDDIKNIRVRKYRLKNDVALDSNAPHHIGVIAQELEEVSPNLVATVPDYKEIDGEKVKTGETKMVKSSILYMKAVKALQEAMARIEKLETDFNEYKATHP